MTKNKIAWIGALALIGVISTEFGIIGVLPLIADHYGIEIDTAGYLLSGFALVVAVAGPVVTALTGKVNRKWLMATGMALFLLSGIISSLAPPFWLLLIVRFIPALLHPTMISIAVYAATSNADPKDAHTMMSTVIGGVAIATITTVPLITYVAGYFDDWQVAYVLQALFSLIALMGILKVYPSLPVKKFRSALSQLSILKKPVFLLSSIATFLMNGTMFTTYSYFADYMGKALGLDTEMIGILLFVFGFTGVIGNFLTGKYLSKNVTYTMAFFLVGLTLMSLPITRLRFTDSLFLIFFVIAVWGFFHTPGFVNGQAYMIEVASEEPEFANSISISFGNLGISFGTAISGWSISRYGVASIPIVMLIFGSVSLLVMGLKAWVAKKYVDSHPSNSE